jgi:AraC-like DNA-binding protein
VAAAAGTIVASLAVPIIEAAHARGVPRADVETIAGAVGRDSGRRIPIADYLRLWEHAMRASRYPGLPMMVAQSSTLERFGLAGYALYVSETIGHALRRLARFHDLLTDSGRWSIEVEGRDAVLAWHRAGDRTLGMRVANEQILAAAVVIFERLLGSLPVVEVRFRHPPPGDLVMHERLFRAPMKFEQALDAVVLPAELLSRASPGFDLYLERYFLKQAEDAVARIGATGQTAVLASREIIALLADGIPSAKTIAARLGISDRTLRRRLAGEGSSFDELVVAVQRDRADAMLQEGRPVREVALATGFSDPTSFTRAYKRWTGHSPSHRPTQSSRGTRSP